MWLTFVIFGVLLVPAIVVAAIVRDIGDDLLDTLAQRIRDNPEVAKRAAFYRPVQKSGALLAILAVMPVGICIKGATAAQWRQMATISAAMFGAGFLLLGLWWVLASRKAARPR